MLVCTTRRVPRDSDPCQSLRTLVPRQVEPRLTYHQQMKSKTIYRRLIDVHTKSECLRLIIYNAGVACIKCDVIASQKRSFDREFLCVSRASLESSCYNGKQHCQNFSHNTLRRKKPAIPSGTAG